MEEKRVIYDKVRISTRALTVFIVLGLFMTALVTGYGYYLGNFNGGALPVATHKEQESEKGTDVAYEHRSAVQDEAPDEHSYEDLR